MDQKGYHGYRPRDGRPDRDRGREHDSRYERPHHSQDRYSGDGSRGGRDRDHSYRGGGGGGDGYRGGGGGRSYYEGRDDRRYEGRGSSRHGGRSDGGRGDGGRRDGGRGDGGRGDGGRDDGGRGDGNPDSYFDYSASNANWQTKKRPLDQDEGPRKRSHDSSDPSTPNSESIRSPREPSEHPRKKQFVDNESEGGRGQRDKNTEEKPRRDRYEIVRTKPENCQSKTGKAGDKIRLRANFFELEKRPDYEMLMYRVDFSPECELAAKRKYLIYTQRKLLGAYLYDTKNCVYITHRLSQDNVTVTTNDREDNPYNLTIKFGAVVPTDSRESLQVLNLILRRAMEGLKLQLIGRNLYDPLGKIDYNQYRVQLWPGYTTSIRQHEKGVLLCAEIATKVMRKETVYDILEECRCNSRDDFRKSFAESVLGLVVLTDYNNKTYKIFDIDFSTTPSDTFKTKNEGEISFVEYYRKKYNIYIRNPTQPMLVTRSTDRQRRGGEDEQILLVPELCRPTGLTDQQRNNFQLMKAIAEYTRMDPRSRMNALRKYNARLQETAASQEILKAWNLTLGRKLVEMEGRKLKNESIVYGNGVKEPTNQFADWQMAFRDKSMFLSYRLDNWCIIVTMRMKQQMNTFLNNMDRASRQMGFRIDDARIIEVEDSTHAYIKGFEAAAAGNPQLIMAFVSNNNADKYSTIKKMGTCSYGIPTQVIVQKTLNNKSLMTIATKVAIQLNCKLGGTPWLVEIPTKGLMTVGIDVSRDTKDNKKFWGALVATMNLKAVDRESFFSCISSYGIGSDYSAQLVIDITKAVHAYHRHHEALPEKIVVYRDGVGEGQLKFIYETELVQIKNRLEQIYAQNNIDLKMAFIIASKRISTRIFGMDDRNPPPGTIVDDAITLPESQDFLLCGQTVRQGTVSPTRYNVLYNTSGFKADQLQQLTYKQCHLYYNWAGTLRVPAVCQCAHKLSFQVAQFLHQLPSQRLEKKLYFL